MHCNNYILYRKIQIISPGLIFGRKTFSKNLSWEGGGGEAYTWTNINLRFENPIFCSSNCNFF